MALPAIWPIHEWEIKHVARSRRAGGNLEIVFESSPDAHRGQLMPAAGDGVPDEDVAIQPTRSCSAEEGGS